MFASCMSCVLACVWLDITWDLSVLRCMHWVLQWTIVHLGAPHNSGVPHQIAPAHLGAFNCTRVHSGLPILFTPIYMTIQFCVELFTIKMLLTIHYTVVILQFATLNASLLTKRARTQWKSRVRQKVLSYSHNCILLLIFLFFNVFWKLPSMTLHILGP